MFRFVIKRVFLKLMLALLFCTSTTLYGQDDLRFTGPLKVGEYTGRADYSYKIVEEDTLLEGPFQMQRSNLEALIEKSDTTFLFKGQFQNGYPTGFWKFQFGEFKSDRRSSIVDYQYRVAISGIQEEANGILKVGKPDGDWTYLVNRITDSEVDSTLFKSTISFENGIPQQSFRIENEKSTLVGRFLRDGLAHDEWSLYTEDAFEANESWGFDDGILQTIIVQENGETKSIPVFDIDLDETKNINLDERYIAALKLHLPFSDSTLALNRGMPELLALNAQYYQKIDAILSELGQSSFLPEFKVKVPYFPLDSVEAVQMDSIKIQFKKSKVISDSLLNNSLLNILRLSDEQASFLYNTVKTISIDFLDPMEKLVGYHNKGILEFVSREELITKLWPDGKPSKEIIVNIEKDSIVTSRTFELQNSDLFDFGGDNIASVQQLAQYTYQGLDSIQHVLNKRLSRQKREQDLIAQEEKLIAQNRALERLIDSSQTLPMAYRKVLEYIKETSDDDLSDFSNREELEYAKRLVVCHEQMNILAKAITVLPEQDLEIRNAYTDRIWNPFTATLMDEEVKKRITTAYRKVLVPYFLKNIPIELSCENAHEWVRLIQASYERVMQLRTEDTSKLERRLRREQNPQKVLQLFNLQGLTKTNG